MAAGTVTIRDRESGELRDESAHAEGPLRWCYGDKNGHWIYEHVLNRAWFSRLIGWWMERPESAARIVPFMEAHDIPESEALVPVELFPHFSAFFSRALMPDTRSFNRDPQVLPSPADGRVLVYPELTEQSRLPVKGASVSLESLLGAEDAAAPFVGGSALVIRLAPHDCHRFHFPDSGEAGPARAIAGRYDSLHPLALSRRPDAYLRNKRSVTRFDSDHFGPIGYVEVGALCVGTIVQSYSPGERVARGEEKGYFQLGGSTLVLLFEHGAIAFDRDLVEDSAEGREVRVRAGTRLGVRPG